MNSEEMVADNINTASVTKIGDVTEADEKMLKDVVKAINHKMKVGCTGCGYCMPCPAGVEIPRIFAMYNQMKLTGNRGAFTRAYNALDEDAQASACVACGKCVKA